MPNVPNLRFGEWSSVWETKKLGEISKFSKGKGISKIDIDENGEIECIRYGELYTHYGEFITEIKSRTNIARKNLVFSEANDVIIPASGETQIDIATASCVLKSGVALGGDLNIIKTPNNGVFLSYYLNSKKKRAIANLAQGISVVHLYSSQLAVLEINLPCLTEQQKIANFLSLIDERILTQNKIIQQLESLIKGINEKLFTQRLRFKDENGNEFPDWEEKKLGEITCKVDRKNKSKENLPIYSISNVNGFVPQSEQFDGLDSNDRGYDITLYKIVEKETFAYNPARINVGSIGYSGSIEKAIISSLYVCFKTNDIINDSFFNYFLQTNHFKNSVLKNGEGGVRIYLFYENFSEITIRFPAYKEQTRIANFLSSVNEKIKAEKKILNQLENQKKYLLQNLFI